MPQRSLRLSSFLVILFSLFCSALVISNILSSNLLIHSSTSVFLLLIPSNVFLISVIVLLVADCLFFKPSRSLLTHFSYLLNLCLQFIYLCLHFISKILNHLYYITLNSFSGRLLIFSSFVLSYVFLPYSFIFCMFLYLFILFNSLCLGSSNCRLEGC